MDSHIFFLLILLVHPATETKTQTKNFAHLNKIAPWQDGAPVRCDKTYIHRRQIAFVSLLCYFRATAPQQLKKPQMLLHGSLLPSLKLQNFYSLSTLRICRFSVILTIKKTCSESSEWDQRNSSSLSLASMLDGGRWLMPRPVTLPTGISQYPLCRRLGGPHGPVWTGAKNFAPSPGFDPRTVQPIAGRITDYAIPTHNF
jgi:hypothetical protein